jgi:hypothetical protein
MSVGHGYKLDWKEKAKLIKWCVHGEVRVDCDVCMNDVED